MNQNTNQNTLPAFTEQEMALVLGSSIGANVRMSLRHARDIRNASYYNNVLYINTVQTSRKLGRTIKEELGIARASGIPEQVELSPNKVFHVFDAELGELHKCKDELEGTIWANSITHVIINSWEFASKNPRYREELLFLIRHFLKGVYGKDAKFPFQPLTVLIYAQAAASIPAAQKLQRGGFGKLAGLADSVIVIKEAATDETEAKIITMTEIPKDEDTFIEEIIRMSKEEPEEVFAEYEDEKEVEVEEEDDDYIKQGDIEIDGVLYPSEDEEGISEDEATQRFMARVKAAGRYEQKLKEEKITDYELGITNKEERVMEEVSTTEDDSSLLRTNYERPMTGLVESANEILADFREIPNSIAMMPIHQNSYSNDKAPKPSKPLNRKERRRIVYGDVVHK